MITFDINRSKYKLYYFPHLNKELDKYKNSYNDVIAQGVNNPTKVGAPKSIEDIAAEDALSWIKKYIDKLAKDPTLPLSYLNFDDKNIKDFLVHIFANEREELIAAAHNKSETITFKNFQDFIKLCLLQEDFFKLGQTQLSLSEFEKILKCLENFHTHSSKYVDSSTNLLLNQTAPLQISSNFNSSSFSYGLPFSTNFTGGFGREYTNIVKGCAILFDVEGIKISMYEVIMNCLNGIQDDFTKEVGKYLNFNPNAVNTIIPSNLVQGGEMKSAVSQVLWFDGAEFSNFIPLPSVKMLSSLVVLKDKINKIYLENEANKIGLNLASEPIDKKENKEWHKKIANIGRAKFVSRRIKSVASNPMNISDFASLQSGAFERFFSYKYIPVISSPIERQFYFLKNVILENKITNKQLQSKFAQYSSNGKLNFDVLPNSVVKRLLLAFITELSHKIADDVKAYVYKLKLLNKDKRDFLIKNMKEDSTHYLFQKYCLFNDQITLAEKKEIASFLILKYENINDLPQKEQDLLKEATEGLI